MKVPTRPWSVGVVIPARNEQSTIEACIDSILKSADRAGPDAYHIVVVADSCSDLTALLARRALGAAGQVLECEAKSAGTARRLGAAAVLRFFKHRAARHIWLANTDADSTVPLDWLAVQLQFADAGETGIAGIVRLQENGLAAAHELYRKSYLTLQDGTHGHVHGANLAVRADAYLDAGGWSHRELAEDHCLWRRLRRRGWRVCSPVSSVVLTSPRLEGRAAGGFADTLRAGIEAAGAEP